jgi:hypothetical protein
MVKLLTYYAPEVKPPEPRRKRGRPRADIDHDIVFHMVVNGAPRKVIAKHFGVCVDTILVNCRQVISEARIAGQKKWMEIYRFKNQAIIEEHRRRLNASLTKVR